MFFTKDYEECKQMGWLFVKKVERELDRQIIVKAYGGEIKSL